MLTFLGGRLKFTVSMTAFLFYLILSEHWRQGYSFSIFQVKRKTALSKQFLLSALQLDQLALGGLGRPEPAAIQKA